MDPHSPQFMRGRVAEEFVSGLLRRDGWYVIPSALYSGPNGDHAPMADGATDRIVLPDLDIARNGSRRWAEVKAKADATYSRCTRTYDHGIGRVKWQHYCRIQEHTGCHVWLYIIEERRQLVLAESLDALGVGRIYSGALMDPGGMMFWPRQRFTMRVRLNALPGFGEAIAFMGDRHD